MWVLSVKESESSGTAFSFSHRAEHLLDNCEKSETERRRFLKKLGLGWIFASGFVVVLFFLSSLLGGENTFSIGLLLFCGKLPNELTAGFLNNPRARHRITSSPVIISCGNNCMWLSSLNAAVQAATFDFLHDAYLYSCLALH